jgi:hypothetical protein
MTVDLTLHRFAEHGKNTLGVVRIEHMAHPTIFTCEDLWQNNRPNISCIPPGEYRCDPHGWEANSLTKFKKVWRVIGVPGRSAILFGHVGNDHTDTEGCILPGFGIWNAGITDSQKALDYLRKTIGEKSFNLTVKSDIID